MEAQVHALSVHVVFTVDKVALGQVFLQVLRLSLVSVISPGLHTHMPSGGLIIGPLEATVQRQYHPIHMKIVTINC
jgi:hypothetical protein